MSKLINKKFYGLFLGSYPFGLYNKVDHPYLCLSNRSLGIDFFDYSSNKIESLKVNRKSDVPASKGNYTITVSQTNQLIGLDLIERLNTPSESDVIKKIFSSPSYKIRNQNPLILSGKVSKITNFEIDTYNGKDSYPRRGGQSQSPIPHDRNFGMEINCSGNKIHLNVTRLTAVYTFNKGKYIPNDFTDRLNILEQATDIQDTRKKPTQDEIFQFCKYKDNIVNKRKKNYYKKNY